MKKIFFVFTLFAVVFSIQAQTVKEGTIVNIKLTDDATSKDDDEVIVEAEVAQSVFSPTGELLISEGTPAIVQKENICRARAWGEEGSMTLRVISTTAVDGKIVHLSAELPLRGQNRRGTAIASGIVCGIIFCPIGFLGFCKKGTQAYAGEGTIIPSVVR